MKYNVNMQEDNVLMKDMYSSAFDGNLLQPNSYYGQDLLYDNDIERTNKVSVFMGNDSNSTKKSFNIARKAVEKGAEVDMYYRPSWFPTSNGIPDDKENTYHVSIKNMDDLRDIESSQIILGGRLEKTNLDNIVLDQSYVVSTFWNRNLEGIRELSNKTTGYLGSLEGLKGTHHAYIMERFLIENVDEFRTTDSKNRQILEERHLDLNKDIVLMDERQTELTGKKILYVSEFDLDHSMVSRWRHIWPSNSLGKYGARYKIKGALERCIERDENKQIQWSQEMRKEFERRDWAVDDESIRKYVLEGIMKDIDEADIVVFGRTSNKFLKSAFKHAKNKGKIVGYEVDDLIFGDNAIESYKEKDQHNKSSSEYISEQIKDADFVTTSTDSLAKEISKIRGNNENVHIIRNRMHLNEIKDFMPKEKKSNKLRIGWAGSYHHIDKLINMSNVFRRIKDEFKDDVSLVFKGIDESYMKTPEFTEKFKEFKSRMHGVDYELHPYTKQGDWKQYYRDLADLDLDIFVSPAKDDNEHKGKSELKFLEGAFCGAANVAHKSGGFEEDPLSDKDNISLVDLDDLNHNNEEFYKRIKELIENPEIMNRLKRNGVKTLFDNYNVDKSSEELFKIFSHQVRKKNGKR